MGPPVSARSDNPNRIRSVGIARRISRMRRPSSAARCRIASRDPERFAGPGIPGRKEKVPSAIPKITPRALSPTSSPKRAPVSLPSVISSTPTSPSAATSSIPLFRVDSTSRSTPSRGKSTSAPDSAISTPLSQRLLGRRVEEVGVALVEAQRKRRAGVGVDVRPDPGDEGLPIQGAMQLELATEVFDDLYFRVHDEPVTPRRSGLDVLGPYAIY